MGACQLVSPRAEPCWGCLIALKVDVSSLSLFFFNLELKTQLLPFMFLKKKKKKAGSHWHPFNHDRGAVGCPQLARAHGTGQAQMALRTHPRPRQRSALGGTHTGSLQRTPVRGHYWPLRCQPRPIPGNQPKDGTGRLLSMLRTSLLNPPLPHPTAHPHLPPHLHLL